MELFKFWCQKVLPLVYDNSLSYYEVLCKVVDYINKLIDDDKVIIKDVDNLKTEVNKIKYWIEHYDTIEIEKLIKDYIATSVFFGLTDNGYFVAYIPNSWGDIKFGTTGLDTVVGVEPEYGHLILSY